MLKNELYILITGLKKKAKPQVECTRVDRWTTRRLIDYLKFSVYTHHQPRRRDIVADINDELKIYDYDVDKDVKNCDGFVQTCKKIRNGMKNARKTFTNVADEEDISEKLKNISLEE